LSNTLHKIVLFIQFLTEKTQGEIADSINYSRAHFNVLLKKGPNPDLEKLLKKRYEKEIDEFFQKDSIVLSEPESEYGNDYKIVDFEEMLTHDTIIIKGMLRVMLKNQATIIAAQLKQPVSSVLKKITKDVRDETKEEFDEL